MKTLYVAQDFHVPLRTVSSGPLLVAQRRDHSVAPHPELIFRQWPRLPVLVELPPQATEMAPVVDTLRREVVSVYCVVHTTHVFIASERYVVPAGRCVLVHPDRQSWLLGVAPTAGDPAA